MALALKSLGLTKSCFYYRPKDSPSKRSKKPLDGNLVTVLESLQGYEQTIGCVKLTSYIRAQKKGIFNHKKVYRHMKALKLLQPKIGKKSRLAGKKTPDVSFYSPLMSNVRWEADLTYVGYQHGNMYLFTVIDVFDRESIGSWTGLRCRAEEAAQALENAVKKRFPDGVIPVGLTVTVRVDRGCQYTAELFGNTARRLGIHVEYCDVQAPNQKAFVESFFSCFKREEVYRNDYADPIEASIGWYKYEDWYNHHRPHGSLGNLSPVQFRAEIAKKTPINIPVFCPN
jgi:putative transposase